MSGSTRTGSAPLGPVAKHSNRERVRWGEVVLVYAREMRGAMRERTIVVNSILLPILLYPFILWVAFTALAFVQGRTSGAAASVAVNAWPAEHPGLRRLFELQQSLKLIGAEKSAEEAKLMLRDGRLDVFLQFSTNSAAKVEAQRVAPSQPHPELEVFYNQARDRSASAYRRVSTLVEEYREKWLKREALLRGASPAEWQQVRVVARNIASGKQVGGFVLGLMLPAMFVVMVAMGCFYPAVDSTAGERERQTWETLMSTSAQRVSIVAGKYLYVATLGGLAGVLNLLALAATVKPIFAPLLRQTGTELDLTIPLTAVPFLLVAAVLLSGFVAAGMMLFAAFARTFKEGQAMITPFYLMIILPIMFLQTPGLKLTPQLALVPIANVTLLARTTVMGSYPLLEIALTVLSSLALIAVCLRIATFILEFEDVMVGSYNGSFLRFLGRRALGLRPAVRRTG